MLSYKKWLKEQKPDPFKVATDAIYRNRLKSLIVPAAFAVGTAHAGPVGGTIAAGAAAIVGHAGDKMINAYVDAKKKLKGKKDVTNS